MGIEARTVSDAMGRIANYQQGGDEFSIGGTIQQKNIYTFYAVATSATDVQEITLVLPVGGSVSGIYRFPRVGEKVLVEIASAGNYLLGYIPSEGDNPFAPVKDSTTVTAEKNKLLDTGQGMAFRYKQTGKKPDKAEAGEQYSEIGFYHEPTQWEPKSADDYTDIPKKEKDKKQLPAIDRINIQSTGDIKSKAQNFHQTKAKRFELLVNCDEVDHSTDSYPFGDRPGDDSSLYAGDAHIRAKNRIIVKAGDEIVFEVGRSSIVINDEGIYLASRKTQSNITNGWDTMVSLKAQDGIAMFGQHVGIASGVDFTITEGYGGKIYSRLGIMRINGYDIRAETINGYNYIATGIVNGIDWLTNAVTQICGAANADTSSSFMDMGSLVSAKAIRLGAPFIGSLGNSKKAGGDKDMFGPVVSLLDIIMKVVMVVGIILDKTIPKEKKFKHGRDGLYTALSLVEYGAMVAAFATSGALGLGRGLWESFIHLTTGGDLSLEGFRYAETFVNKPSAASPLAGATPPDVKMSAAYKGSANEYVDKVGGRGYCRQTWS
jgi:hypothetical protein